MVGLLLTSGLVAKEGDSLYGQEVEEGVAPWAAALSDELLASNCAACFGVCAPPSRFPCEGSCHGTLTYCSISCRNLDLPLHNHSGECYLLSLLQTSVSTSSARSLFDSDESSFKTWSSFPYLGGNCGLRAALRLLARHEALHHIGPFLAASRSRLECARLGGLLSNRSTLLQPTPSHVVDKTSEIEEEELLIATELREAALLMHQARYSTSSKPCRYSPLKHNERVDYDLGDVSIPDTGHANVHADVCVSTTGQIGSKHLDNIARTHGNIRTQNDIFMGAYECLGARDSPDQSVDTHKDVNMATNRNLCTRKDTHAEGSLTLSEELLLVEEVISQVFTNGVCIQADTWFSDWHSYMRSEDLGTAVYGPMLSWINHSCRPNAVYSFVLTGSTIPKGTLKVPLVPDTEVKGLEDAWGLRSWCFPRFETGLSHYGPRVCLRSIREIKALEPVCISYVDLVQPKNMRRQELWMKYRFNCICERCAVKSTNDVDAILENIAMPEDWLHKEVQRGLNEFLHNDNPSFCCKIMEDALLRVLHDRYQNWLCQSALPVYATRLDSFNCYGGFCGHNLCSDASERKEVRLNFNLMHRSCLDIYTALASSYKVLATGFITTRLESSPMYGTDAIEERKEVECSLASAAYTLILAATIQCMYDHGEPGILGFAARSWSQTGEAFINLIRKLDSYLFLEEILETEKLFSQLGGDCRLLMVFFCEKVFVGEMKGILNAHGRLTEACHLCDSTFELLRCMITSLWPILRNSSPFLMYIETPLDISKVTFRSAEKQLHSLESKDAWVCHRSEAFVGALCCFQHGLKMMNICYGYSEKRIVAMQDFFTSRFNKT